MGTILWKPASPALVEQKESNQWDFGEIITVTKVYRGPFALCLSSASAKGTVGSGELSGCYVTKCSVSRESNGIGKLVVIWESPAIPGGGTQTLPPDEFGLRPLEVNPRVEKHPIFAILDDKQRENVKQAFDGVSDSGRSAGVNPIATVAAAMKLLSKLKKGIETYYLSGFTYTYTFYSWTLPSVTRGGFIQAPGGPLAGSFSGLSCLRGADTLDFTGTLFRCTRTWLCGPDGHWDAELYA